MTGFRVVLTGIFISLLTYTIVVVSNHGLNLLPIFFADMVQMAWPGQFNFDFMCLLILSGLWVAWRQKFSPAGLGLGLLAFFGGALFLSGYLLIESFRGYQSIEALLLGHRV